MNEPSVIQSQQTKWMEVILLWLGILIPIQTGPVIYQYLKWSNSTPDLLYNGLGGLLLLCICIGLFLQYRSLSPRILKAPYSSSETSTRDSELSGWLTIGIFTFGFLFLIPIVSSVPFVLGHGFFQWLRFRSNPEIIEVLKNRMWFDLALSWMTALPQVTIALLFIFFPQALANWTISLQERWRFSERR